MRYATDERECHIWYDPVDNVTKVYTNDPKCMTKFRKANWTVTEEEKDGDRVVSMRFESVGFPITARDVSKPKRSGNFKPINN